MKPTLYQISGAPRGWRVLLALAFKNIDHDIQILRLDRQEHRKPDYLEINPRGTVPALVTGDVTLHDSIGIMAWLDRAYPKTPLFGDSTDEAATIWQIAMDCADFLREANHQFLTQVFSSDGTIPATGSTEAASLRKAADLVHGECRNLEDILADGRPFLAGDKLSAADAIAFPEIRLLEHAVLTKNELTASVGFGYPPDLYPNVAAWKARLNEMPMVAATLPPHWNEPVLNA